jgi:hypothetical protein
VSVTASPSPPVWSPSPMPVLFGAGWVLLGSVGYLITARPLVLVIAVGASCVTTVVASARERKAAVASPQHDEAEDPPLPRTVVDLEARLALDAGRR